MRILSAAQLKEADAFTITNEPVSSIALMERAAEKCSHWLLTHYGKEIPYVVFCGNGNNGGDGLAIARQLAAANCTVEVFIVKAAATDSTDFSVNENRLAEQPEISASIVTDAKSISFPEKQFILVDAIFGSGLSREPENLAADVIDRINTLAIPKIAIDIPSGYFCDDNSKNSCAHVVRATYTLTFQQPKLSFFFAESALYIGDFHVQDIGLHPAYLLQADTPFHYVEHEEVKRLLKPRGKFSHKGTFGHALLIAGSKGKMGAVVLSAGGCLRSGTGLLTITSPACGTNILQTSVPEAMLQENEGEDFISGRIKTGPGSKTEFSAIGIGPGIGTEKETEQAMKLLLNEFGGPYIIDADGLNILAENKTWLAFLPKGTILTPHPGEFDRLTEKHNSGFARMQAQRALAIKNGIYIVLKGAFTSIACPDGSVFFNSSGNPGMGTGGSGDVLTGILTGLRAQAYNPQSACVIGVYVHGLAGDIAASVHTTRGMNSGDIVENLGGAWRMLE